VLFFSAPPREAPSPDRNILRYDRFSAVRMSPIFISPRSREGFSAHLRQYLTKASAPSLATFMEVDALSVGEAGKGLEEKRLVEGLRPGWVAIALPPRRSARRLSWPLSARCRTTGGRYPSSPGSAGSLGDKLRRTAHLLPGGQNEQKDAESLKPPLFPLKIRISLALSIGGTARRQIRFTSCRVHPRDRSRSKNAIVWRACPRSSLTN